MTAIKDVEEYVDESKYAFSDELSVRFMRSVKEDYGRDKAVETMNMLQQALGKDWAGRVLLHMTADHYRNMGDFTLVIANPTAVTTKKITAIKIIRELSGMGLGESKTFVELVMAGRPQKAAFQLGGKMNDPDKQRLIRNRIEELRDCGFVARVG